MHTAEIRERPWSQACKEEQGAAELPCRESSQACAGQWARPSAALQHAPALLLREQAGGQG